MAAINYDKMSLKELLDHQVKLEKALAGARDRERADVKHKVESLIQSAGFSIGDLFGGRSKQKGSAPKYANPDNRSETWTGRGRKPNWLVAKLAKGAKMDEFAIR